MYTLCLKKVPTLPTHLRGCLHRVSLPRQRPLKLPLSCEVVEKRWFWGPICRCRGYLTFRACVFKSHLLPSMWPILVKFRSANSDGSGRKEDKRIAVKPKSADNYMLDGLITTITTIVFAAAARLVDEMRSLNWLLPRRAKSTQKSQRHKLTRSSQSPWRPWAP